MISKFYSAGINPFMACNMQKLLEKIMYKEIDYSKLFPKDTDK